MATDLPAPSIRTWALPKRGAWKPTLREDLRIRALDALEGIYAATMSPDASYPSSLAGGTSGMALFWAYASVVNQEEAQGFHRAKALLCLDRASESLGSLASFPSFYSGFSGVAWVVDHLTRLGLLAPEEDLNEEVDEALLQHLAPADWKGLPELIEGLAGIGLYALDRGGAGQSAAILDRVLDHLEAKAELQPVGVAWFDPPENLNPFSRQSHPKGYFNLGVSHGIPGVLGFLAEAAAHGHARALHLLEPGMAWFLAQAFDPPTPGYYTASLERGEQPKSGGGRLSWCYGDLGIAVTLLMAARKVGNPVWEEWALTIAHQCTRRPVFGQGTLDGSLCHGAFGNGHLFGRLYNATGEDAFLEQANRYFELGLGMRRDTSESAGFFMFHPPLEGEPERDPYLPNLDLLEGCAGIGLALLAATSYVEPQWDRFLLAHVPPVAF